MKTEPARRAQPDGRADYAVFRSVPTRWSDNDLYGHMNNVVHYSLFDTAVNGWLIDNGLLDLAGGSHAFLVAETGCSYFSEIAFPQTVTAGLRVGRLGNSSIRYEIGLFVGDGERAAAQGHFVHVRIDRASRRPSPLQPEERAKLEALQR